MRYWRRWTIVVCIAVFFGLLDAVTSKTLPTEMVLLWAGVFVVFWVVLIWEIQVNQKQIRAALWRWRRRL